jgi:cytochrome c553
MVKQSRWRGGMVGLGGAVCLLGGFFVLLPGCGANLSEIFYQSVAAAGRTLLDQVLTDVANDLAEQGEDQPDEGDGDGNGDGDDGDGNGGNGDGDGEEPPPGDLTGDAARGETLFASSGCGGCHCADAVGGCLPGAPGLVNIALDVLTANLTGGDPHPTSPNVSNQDIADLQAFLTSLGE